MMASIVDISTAIVLAAALAALFYFTSKLVIALVVAGAVLVGYALSFVNI